MTKEYDEKLDTESLYEHVDALCALVGLGINRNSVKRLAIEDTDGEFALTVDYYVYSKNEDGNVNGKVGYNTERRWLRPQTYAVAQSPIK